MFFQKKVPHITDTFRLGNNNTSGAVAALYIAVKDVRSNKYCISLGDTVPFSADVHMELAFSNIQKFKMSVIVKREILDSIEIYIGKHPKVTLKKLG